MTGMKMALASDEDMEVAYELCGLLDNLSRGYYPAKEEDADTPTFFDEDDTEHLQALHKRIEKIAESSGAVHRVVGGFSCMRNPANELIDPTQDVVEFHPSIIAGREAVEKLAQIRATIAAYYEKQDDDTGRRAATQSTEVQLVNDLLVLLNNMDGLAVSAGADAHRAIERAQLAESRLESATQPLDEQMARLNQRVIELNAENEALRKALPFQARVRPWMLECFGAEIAADRMERNHRFYEEAGEAVQANGMTREEAHALVDYTWDRPVGELHQEVGGVMVTLAALCLASGVDMHAAGETELARINVPETVVKIRAKQAAKPKHSPLPEAAAQPDERAPLPGVVVVSGSVDESTIAQMDAVTDDWTARAARGECGWICADCGQSFPDGMPDKCMHGNQRCTDIITRDKRAASPQSAKGNP
ncbi:hypothetical protein QYH69_32470 [Paraburkholderia sp. SARCC-3016]|uniref:hypothetical protein n=1 Tax=Paraburkholderia sp. SARCC-3016 TaxID=3058611 RepID=UPI002807AA0A|nr:hypothetical protein [Paraburkholderia sp. SARCC-3016]MDQ7981940.1 hypothetical protein [Paraburkholderia sp. SARCC-3016]